MHGLKHRLVLSKGCAVPGSGWRRRAAAAKTLDLFEPLICLNP